MNNPVKISKNSLNLEHINEGGRNRCAVVLLTGSFSRIALEALHKCCLTCSQSRLVLVFGKIRSDLRDERVVCYDSSFSWKRGRRTGLSQPCVLEKSCRQTISSWWPSHRNVGYGPLQAAFFNCCPKHHLLQPLQSMCSPHILAMIFCSQGRKSFKSCHSLQN